MGKGKLVVIGLLIISVVLNSETTGPDEQSNTYFLLEGNIDYGHNNSSETSCEAPRQPYNGGYVNDTDVDGNGYSPGDTIAYYCNPGHKLIGQSNRTCNGTSMRWEPGEPYCQRTSCGSLMKPANGGYKIYFDSDGVWDGTGRMVTYYCLRGYRLMGEATRTCNRTTEQWEPDEPYCEPEYVGQLMQRLSGIEAEIKMLHIIEQRITAIENNTLSIGHICHPKWQP